MQCAESSGGPGRVDKRAAAGLQSTRAIAFKLTYSTMFDPPEELHARFEAALAGLRVRLGAVHALHIDGQDKAAAESY